MKRSAVSQETPRSAGLRQWFFNAVVARVGVRARCVSMTKCVVESAFILERSSLSLRCCAGNGALPTRRARSSGLIRSNELALAKRSEQGTAHNVVSFPLTDNSTTTALSLSKSSQETMAKLRSYWQSKKREFVPTKDMVIIYTDGACVGNPGPGGYGVVIAHDGQRKDLFGGFSKTTNNRMEVMAAIIGLEALEPGCRAVVYSDSKYLVNAMELGWARSWQRRDWHKSNGERALNSDLWERLLAACYGHEVHFEWVKGHAGNDMNMLCDTMAEYAARQKNLPVDVRSDNGHH